MWKCDCKILEFLILLSNRRKSINMAGEHKNVTSYEYGEYKIISKEDIKKNCTGEAEIRRNKSLELKRVERLAKETSTNFVQKEDEKIIDKPEIGNNN
jgi:hypothetical protein